MSYIQNYSFAQPPPGITPNFENPEHNTTILYITTWICLPLIFIFTASRVLAILTRAKRSFGWSDGIFLIAFCGAVSCISLYIAIIRTSPFVGYHLWDLKIGNFTKPLVLVSCCSHPTSWNHADHNFFLAHPPQWDLLSIADLDGESGRYCHVPRNLWN